MIWVANSPTTRSGSTLGPDRPALAFVVVVAAAAVWGVTNIAIRRAAPADMRGEAVHATGVIGGALVVGGVLAGVLARRSGPPTADREQPDAQVEPGREIAARRG